MTSKQCSVASTVTTGEVITAETGTPKGQPVATTLVRRSESVRMPAGAPAMSTTSTALWPLRTICWAASWMVASGGVVAGAVIAISPTRVVNSTWSLEPRNMLLPRISREVMSTYLVRWNWTRYSITEGCVPSNSFSRSRGSR